MCLLKPMSWESLLFSSFTFVMLLPKPIQFATTHNIILDSFLSNPSNRISISGQLTALLRMFSHDLHYFC